jgi:hypothetical protein
VKSRKFLKMSIAVRKTLLRRKAAKVFGQGRFEIEERTGKGIRPGARLTAKPPEGPALEVAVRTGRDRSLGCSRLRDGSWRTLPNVDVVLGVFPDGENPGAFAVLAFPSEKLKSWYDKALKAMEDAGRSPALDVPIFIPLDEKSKKNVGHDIAGLKGAADWTGSIGPKELEEQNQSENVETFIDRVKREFAERNEVDVSKVSVEFRILA